MFHTRFRAQLSSCLKKVQSCSRHMKFAGLKLYQGRKLLTKAFKKYMKVWTYLSKLGLPYELTTLVWTKISLDKYSTYRSKMFGHFGNKTKVESDWLGPLLKSTIFIPPSTNQKFVVGRKNMWFPNWPIKNLLYFYW